MADAPEQHSHASDERQLRKAIAAGARAAATPGWAGSSKLAAAIARGAVAQHDLALLLSRKGLHEEADAHLRALGMRFKLSPAILSPFPCDVGLKDKRARLDAGAGMPLVFDNVLPSALLSALKQAFRPGSAFWQDHNYPTPGFFSYRHDLRDPRPPLLAVEQAARLIAPMVASSMARLHMGDLKTSTTHKKRRSGHSQNGDGEVYPVEGGFRTVEWWAHRRRPGDGHQLHFDLDEVTLLAGGDVHHPLVSTVLYLSGSGDTCRSRGGGDGGSGPSPALVPPHPPTLVTTQTLHGGSGAAAQNADAHLVWPRNNRLMIFRGDRLHGVLPGPKAPGAHPATPLGEPYPKRRAAELSSFEGGALGKGKPGPDTREIDEVGEIDEISEIGEIDEDRVTLMFGWWGEGHTPPLPSKRLTTQPKAAAGPPLAPCMRLPRPAPPSPPATSRRAALPSAAAGARHAAPPTSAAGARRADARGEEEDYMRNRWRQVPNWVAEGAAIPVILGAGGSDLPRAGATSDLGVCCCLHRPDEAVGRSNRRKRAGPADIQEQQNPASMGSAGDVTVGKPSQGAVTSVGRVWVNVPAMPDPNPPTPRLVSLLGQGSVSFRSLFFLESFDQIEALGRRPQSAAAADAAPHDARASASASVCAGVAGPGAEPRKGVARHGGGGGADDDCEVVDLASARAQMDRQRDGLRGAPKDRLAKGAGGSAASGEAEEEEVFDLAAARALAEQQRDGARHLSDRPLALAALPLRCAMPWRVQGAL